MTPLHKTINRLIKFKVAGIGVREYIVSISPHGLHVRKKGGTVTRSLSWYKLIGILVVHGKKEDSRD